MQQKLSFSHVWILRYSLRRLLRQFTQLLFEEGVLIRSYKTTLTREDRPTTQTLSQMLSAPDQVLFQKKLTNFQRLLIIYNKSMKNGYYRSKKHKLFYLVNDTNN
jgi:hypothetical protein